MKLTDKGRLALVACVVILQVSVALSLLLYTTRVKSHALRTGSVISLSCRAYDPFSPFKGRYVRLSFDQSDLQSDTLDDGSMENMAGRRDKKVYCRMKEGDAGIWTVTGIRRELPEKDLDDGCVYIEAKCRWFNSHSVRLDYGFDEYYMQENYARYVDRIQGNDFNALEPVLSLYVGKNGRCVQKGLTVLDNGERIPIEEYCRRRF